MLNEHNEIVKECVGCGHIYDNCCRIYLDPSAKWRSSPCPMCTTLVRGKDTSTQQKQRVGQQKQKKIRA